MQSLVLGGTGMVGRHILDQLVRAGERPFALSRSQQSSDQVEWVMGDLAESGRLRIPPFSTLYCTAHAAHLAAAIPSLHNSDLRRVILFTSTSLVTKIDSEIAEERDGLRRLAEGEANVVARCRDLDVAYTVLRPTLIYDEGRDVNVTRLANLIRRFGVLPLAGAGAGLRQPVHAQDLAIGALQAAASDAAVDQIYALPGRDMISYREMVGRIFDGLGRRRQIIPVPPLLWRTAFLLARARFPNANVAMGDRMAKDMVFDGSAAARDFGWNPRGFHPKFVEG